MIKKILHKNLIEILFGTAAVFVLGGLVWAFFALREIGGVPLILHFDDVNGITGGGGLGYLIFMGLLGLLIIGMNFALAREFTGRSRFMSGFLGVATLIFAVLLFIAFAVIINVNV